MHMVRSVEKRLDVRQHEQVKFLRMRPSLISSFVHSFCVSQFLYKDAVSQSRKARGRSRRRDHPHRERLPGKDGEHGHLVSSRCSLHSSALCNLLHPLSPPWDASRRYSITPASSTRRQSRWSSASPRSAYRTIGREMSDWRARRQRGADRRRTSPRSMQSQPGGLQTLDMAKQMRRRRWMMLLRRSSLRDPERKK